MINVLEKVLDPLLLTMCRKIPKPRNIGITICGILPMTKVLNWHMVTTDHRLGARSTLISFALAWLVPRPVPESL